MGIAGFIANKSARYIATLNLAAGLTILLYWIQKEARIIQHTIDLRKIIGLCYELGVVGVAVYSIVSNHSYAWVKFTQYIVFGIHLLVLISFLNFMLTFKMNRLF